MNTSPQTHKMKFSELEVKPNFRGNLYPMLFRLLTLRAKFPTKVLGPHKLISSVRFRVPGGTLCQVFYPAKRQGIVQKRSYYTKNDMLRALAANFNSSAAIMSPVSGKKHHVRDSLPLDDSVFPEPGKAIIFSHGLTGGCDIYSLLCRDLASLGYTVWALEHEDHSAAFARSEDGKPIYYVEAPSTVDANSKQQVVDFRIEPLEKRLSEIEVLYNLMKSPSEEALTSVGPLISSLLEAVDMTQMVMAGHSFGACTSIMEVNKNPDRYVKCILYDVWSHPVPQEILDKGLSIPTLSILSEVFTSNNFTVDTLTLMKESKEGYSYYIPGTVHQSFSDAPFFVPYARMARKAYLCGTKDRKLVHEIIHVTTRKFLSLTESTDDVREPQYVNDILPFNANY